MTRSKLKSDVILLKINSGDAWFANASVNGTSFKFLMDAGASKSVISSERSYPFQSCFDHNYTIPE